MNFDLVSHGREHAGVVRLAGDSRSIVTGDGGRVYRRCGCRDAGTGRHWGARRPLLGEPDHGSWYFAVQVGSEGRAVQRVRRGGFSSRREAERQLLGVERRRGPAVLAQVWTLRQWLNVWLLESAERVRPSTLAGYRSVVTQHLVPRLGRVRLSTLTVKAVQRAMDAVSRSGARGGGLISAGTVTRIAAVLRSALSEARRQGLISGNPAWRLRLPNGSRPTAVVWNADRERLWRTTGVKPKVAVWDVDCLAAFLAGVRGDPLFGLWRLVSIRGLRRGEAAGVQGADFDFTLRELSVSRQVIVIDGVRVLGPPKSATSVRRVALDETTNRILRRHWVDQRRCPDSVALNPDGFMFTGPDGRPVRPDWLTRRFAVLVKGLDLPPVRFHDLRHGAASLAGAAAVPLKVIQHDLGHSSAVTTADTYLSVFREAGHAAVAAEAQLLLNHARVRLGLAGASQA